MTILIVSVSKVDNLDLFLETSFSLPFSEGEVNANQNVTCSPSLAENDSDCSRIAKEIAMVRGFFVEGRRQTLLYSCK